MTRDLPGVLPLIGLYGIVLSAGAHASREAGVCAMEAVAWLAGEPHADHPTCACPVIGAFMRSWNDALLDDETRNRLLKPLLPLLVGSKSTAAVERQRSYLALDWLARECAPAWLSLRDDLKAHAVALRGLPPLTDAEACHAAWPTLNATRAAAVDAAGAAAADAAADAAWTAAWAAGAGVAAGAAWTAAWAPAVDAAGAAAADAAWTAAWAAAVDAAGDAAKAAAGDAAGAAAEDAAWAPARAAARAAAGAAGDALAPTVTDLQASAVDLVKRMVGVTP